MLEDFFVHLRGVKAETSVDWTELGHLTLKGVKVAKLPVLLSGGEEAL